MPSSPPSAAGMTASLAGSARHPEPSPSRTATGPGRPASVRRLLAGRDLPVRLAAAGAGGAALALAFPPYGWWPLALVGVASLVAACRGMSGWHGALLGLVHGAVFFTVLLSWMRVVGVDALLGLALLQAAFHAALGAGLAAVSRLRQGLWWAPAVWVAEETARSLLPFGGFPWGRLAFAVTGSPLLPYAAVGGAALVSAAVALVAVALLRAVVGGGAGRVGALCLAALVVLGALLVPLPTDGRPVTAAVVQGNVPAAGLDFTGEREQVLRNHVTATERLARDVAAGTVRRPDLVVWPENASDIDLFRDPAARALVDGAVRAVGVPVLVGVVTAGPAPDEVSNTGVVWDPVTGPGARYVKRHPVPFGEYIPFRSWLEPRVQRLQRIPRDFAAGSRPGVLPLGPARVGDLICFEVAYDGLARDVVDGGADVLVVQTNNATYARTGQPEQQLAMSRLRAVEHGRAVLVAATSGISAVVAPDGRVVTRSAEMQQRVLVERVALRGSPTLADRVEAGPMWLVTMVGVLGMALGARGARRERRRRRERS